MNKTIARVSSLLFFSSILAAVASAQGHLGGPLQFGHSGTVPIYGTTPQFAGLQNHTPYLMVIYGSRTITNGPFTLTAPQEVGPGGYVTVSGTFDPSAFGPYGAQIQFSYLYYNYYPGPPTGGGATVQIGASGTYDQPPSIFDPLYKVVSILYSPPGNQSSQGYSTGTTNGTTTTVGNSFTFSRQITFGTGFPGIFSDGGTIGWSITNSNSQAFTQTYTNTVALATDDNSSTTFNPNHSDAINHHLDSFVIWLNPKVTVNSIGTQPNDYTTTAQATPGVSALVADILPPIPAIAMEPIPGSISQTNPSGISSVPVQFLLPQAIASDSGGGNSYMPGLGAICKNNSLYQQQVTSASPSTPTFCTQANQCGCTPSDFAAILERDDLLNYDASTNTANPLPGTDSPLQVDVSGVSVCAQNPIPTPADCRYVIVPATSGSTTPAFQTLNGTSGITVNQTDSTATTETLGTSKSSSGGLTASIGPLVASLRVVDTWTYTDNESVGTTTGTANTMSLTLKTSTSACEENVNIFEDTLFHSFVFQVPTGITTCQ